MKKVIAIVMLLFVLVPVQARHFLEVGARVGLAGLTYDTDYGTTMPGYHAAVDVGYLYKSPYWVAFRLGATIEAASSSYRKSDYKDSYSVTDVENEVMTIQYNIGVLRERHYSYTASFPIQIGFHIQRFTFLVGPRISLPLSGSYKQTATDASLAVYYPKYKNLVEESLPLAASRSFEMENKGDLTFPKWQCSLAGELTYDFLISSQYGKSESFISVGIYFDAGLTSAPSYPNNEQYGILRLTDTRDGFPLSRIMTPVLQAWREEKPLVAKFGSFDVGFKIAYRLTSAPRQKRRVHGCNCDE
ncbi:MAG: hypothetical protein IKT19_02580 [Paludibacteraceae bacterium]|nr:hypothetical protein [Paludibacteraceae bacterium]